MRHPVLAGSGAVRYGPVMGLDLVLSSGFLAFAEQCGFLRAVEESDLEVDAVCGTSSGALAGALWAAGWTASEILEALTESTPLSQVAMHWPPWEGLFDLGPVRSLLSTQLPRRFSDLPIPLGVGVADLNRSPHLLTDGPLESAVAASCAVPWLFAPVEVQGVLWIDGGVADRTALRAWRAHRPNTQVVLHRVERTAGADHDEDLTAVRVVSSPRSGARLWNLGDVRARYERTRTTALRVLSDVDA